MAKRLSDVLKGTNASRVRPGRTGQRPGVDYASRMPDERDFVAGHETQEFEDRVGNGSDVYNASNIKQSTDKRHGHIPRPADETKYGQHNEQNYDLDEDERPVYTNTRTGETSRSLPPELRAGMGYETEPTSSAVTRSPRPQPNPRRSSNTAPSTSPRPIQRPVREENQVGEEKEMMKRQLHFIKYAADEIMGHVDTVDDPEEWFQNKLSGLHNSIKGLHAYIEGDKRLKNNDMPEMPGMKNEEAEQIDEAGAVVTHKWYSVKHWKDGSDHFDNLDNLLSGMSYKHGALGNTAKNRPDHHLGIPLEAKAAIAYMNKHAKQVNEEAEGDPRVEPKDTKGKGKSLRMITGQVTETTTPKIRFTDIPDEIADHAENAIRHDFHADDAIDHMFSMASSEHRDWIKNNRVGLRNMFKSYGLQTESNNGSPKKTASEQARARFDKKQERREMRQEREDDN